jgi:primosomal protein N' (replication factor Y)
MVSARYYLCPSIDIEVLARKAPAKRRAPVKAQLLLESPDRGRLHECLRNWIPKLEALKAARRVRWSLDVDPLDMP